MRTSPLKWNRVSKSLAVCGILLGGMVCTPLLSAANAPSTSVTIVNNSGTEVRHVYLSPVDQDNWGTDQLGTSGIASAGGTATLNNLSCDGASIKVVAEDSEGCFLYKVVSCSEATTWTITNNDARDCGN